MKPVRSLLYVPANRHSWVVNAPKDTKADGYIFDLEDSVLLDEKQEARDVLHDALVGFHETDAVLTVRVNSTESGLLDDDLAAVVHDSLDAVVVPDVSTPDEIRRIDHVLTYLETTRDINDRIEIILIPETAKGMHNTYELCTASNRVVSITGVTSRGADVERELNWEWTAEGHEKLHLLSKINMEARAAGLSEVLSGAWVDIEDIEGLEAEAKMTRQIGYTGYQVIHPSHIEPVNQIFTPAEEQIEYYKRLVEEFERSKDEDRRSAITFEGEMIDEAHIKTARRKLERARAFGILAD